MNIGNVKGFMVNLTTKRIRIYGSACDLGLDITNELPAQVTVTLGQFMEALQDQYGADPQAIPDEDNTAA